MFKSIFSKYYTVVLLVVICSFAALCGAQTLLSSRYWTDEKRDSLCDTALTVADSIADSTRPNGTGGYVLGESFAPMFTLLSGTDTSSGNVVLADLNGIVVLSTTGEVRQGESLTSEVMEAVRSGCTGREPYFTVGALGGLYAAPQYTAAAPVNYRGQTVAYVLVSSPTDKLSEYLLRNLQVFFWSALTVLALTFAVMYAMTYRLVKPLREMAEATRQFAAGDFSCRLKVRGRDEVAQLAASLNSMAVSLSSLEEMRRSFIGNVSHELKTPMTTIAGFIDGILDGTVPAEKREDYLKIVSDEVKRLSRLVKVMLDLSRIDSGQLKVSPVDFDLTPVVCNVLLSFDQRLTEKQVTVEGLSEIPRMPVRADYDLIGQVVYNLVDNATKFIDTGGTLTLTLYRQEGRVYCRIRNTGMGLAADELPNIFERFYKTDKSRSLDKKGMGLGLYIVKNVLALHGGEITVRSTEGEFCEFEFWLPAAGE